jgi:hypothetical protein
MSVVLGGDASSAALQLGKALNDPIQGISALGRAGVQFNAEQQRTIKSMVDMGDIAGAQGVILGELERQMGGVAEAAGQTLAGSLDAVSNAWGDARQAMGSWFGELPIVRNSIHALERNIRDVEIAINGWRDPARNALSQIKVSFADLGSEVESVEDRFANLSRQNLGALPIEAEGLAKHLKDMADEAKRANTNIDALAQARLDLQLAEIDRAEAAGEISKDDADRQRITLQSSAEQAAIQRDLQQQSEQLKIIAASLQKANADAASREVAFRQALNIYSDTGTEEAGTRAKSAKLEMVEARDRAAELMQMHAKAKAEMDQSRQLASIRSKTVSVRAEAGTTAIDSRQQSAALKAERDRLAAEIKELQARRSNPDDLQSNIDRERAEAEAAEAALMQARNSGNIGGMSTRSFSGSQALRDLEATAARERAEADAAADDAMHAMNDMGRTIMELATRLKDIEGQIRNMP